VELLAAILSLASSGKLIEGSRGERELCELLASLLGAKANTVVNGVEADLLLGSEACEVKLYPTRFYSARHADASAGSYTLHASRFR